jgi:hypothetical protein
LQQVQVVDGRSRSGPILEPISNDVYRKIGCNCRYDHSGKSRAKRELPILRNSVNLIMGLLPTFIRFPIEQTFRSFKHHQQMEDKYRWNRFRAEPPVRLVSRFKTKPPPTAKPSETFLQKLKKLNSDREKRSVIFNPDEISLPFLRVTDVENDLDDSEEEEEDEEDEEQVVKRNPRDEFLQPLNFGHIFPHNPIYYILNTPIRLLHQFHKLGEQISPVFKSVPHVFVNSRKYLRNVGKNLRNDVLNFASNFIGDFDEFDTNSYRVLKPRRYRRSLDGKMEQYEPDYSLVFGNQTEENSRRRRYILKVVDEDEVEQFLREKLGGLVETTERPKKKKDKESNKKKLVVEKLSSKLIIDNNGRPFVEINGVKRPLFLRKTQPEETREKMEEEEKEKDETTQDMKEKINSIIVKARERIGQNPPSVSIQQNVPTQIIKDRINQILTEIQDLINIDFDKYSTVYTDLCKLQSFKELLVNDWKKILMEDKLNDISSKIRILDDFKEMQILRDQSVEDIASILSSGSNFMTKKLIKMLVRLQKLQCVIYRVVEDFGEKIKMGTDFDVRKEIKYVDYLDGLQFMVGRSKHDLERGLKNERDVALENEMSVLDSLRKLLESDDPDPHKSYEEAKLLWEINNIDKLQKDTILEMNGKISRGQKVRKELKILFDLLRQLENCEEKQKKLLGELNHKEKKQDKLNEKQSRQDFDTDNLDGFGRSSKERKQTFDNYKVEEVRHNTGRKRHRGRKILVENTNINRNRNFPHKTIIEDKKPIKLVSNGYTITAYKVSDGLD